jgi:tRNA G37 N-methylase TrmD
VLLSGNHSEIAAWRAAQAERRTRERRPDLMDVRASEIICGRTSRWSDVLPEGQEAVPMLMGARKRWE